MIERHPLYGQYPYLHNANGEDKKEKLIHLSIPEDEMGERWGRGLLEKR